LAAPLLFHSAWWPFLRPAYRSFRTQSARDQVPAVETQNPSSEARTDGRDPRMNLCWQITSGYPQSDDCAPPPPSGREWSKPSLSSGRPAGVRPPSRMAPPPARLSESWHPLPPLFGTMVRAVLIETGCSADRLALCANGQSTAKLMDPSTRRSNGSPDMSMAV